VIYLGAVGRLDYTTAATIRAIPTELERFDIEVTWGAVPPALRRHSRTLERRIGYATLTADPLESRTIARRNCKRTRPLGGSAWS
jgi:hypothetical protein